MKNVGILTFWSVPNYGAFLQAYALQQVLQEMTSDNCNVVQIAYINPLHARLYYGFELHELFRYWAINPRFYRDVLRHILRRKKIMRRRKFLEYYDSMIPHSQVFRGKELEDFHFDEVVLGSDILWDYSMRVFGNEKYVFGNDLDADRITSYAASFGTVKYISGMESKITDYVVRGIRRLDAVSVRDTNSKLIADQIRHDSSAKVVIDPTFLYDFSRCPHVKAPDTEGDYIAVYGSFFTDEMIEGAVRYARKNNLRIICLDIGRDKHSWCDEIISQDKMNPFDWCGYIKHSRAFMTCTYHGLMFGLIYNKKIAFNATQFMLDKAEDFIDKLGLREILIDCKDFHSAMSYEWYYESLNRKFSEMKDEAFEFIRENITKGL